MITDKVYIKLGYLIIFLVCFQSFSVSATKLDSLLLQLNNHQQEDTIRLSLLRSVCFEYKFIEKNKATEYGLKGLALAQKLHNQDYEAEILNILGIVYMEYDDDALALEHFIKARKIFIGLNDTSGLSNISNNIGLIYYKRQQWDEALLHFNEAKKYNLLLADSNSFGNNLNNIAVIYRKKGQLDKAIDYHQQAYNIHEKLKNSLGMADALQNMGIIMYEKEDYNKTLDFFARSIVQRKQAGDLIGVGNLFYNMGFIYQAMKEHDNAIQHYSQSLDIAYKIQSGGLASKNLGALAETYAAKGDFKKACDFHSRFFEIHDSIYNLDKASKISELQTKYETEKNNQSIQLLEAEARLKEAKLLRSRISLLSITTILILISISLLILRKNYLKRIQLNTLLSDTNKKIHQQKNEILIQRNQLEQFNEELLSQKEELEKQKENLQQQSISIENALKTVARKKDQITSSMRYAARLQNALIPNVDLIVPANIEFFQLYQAKDFVSGDFFWLGKLDNSLLLGILNTQLKGTSGAFLSISANNLLKSIIHEKLETSPERIMKGLNSGLFQIMNRENIIHAFSGVRFLFVNLDIKKQYAWVASSGISWFGFINSQIQTFNSQNIGIGLTKEIYSNDFETWEFQLGQGDKLLFPSPGAIECIQSELQTQDIPGFFNEVLSVDESLGQAFNKHFQIPEILQQDITLLGFNLLKHE